jgi:hypothetical protein
MNIPRLMKLTGLVHPDINAGKPSPVYIDPVKILVIERGVHQQTKFGSLEAHRQAVWGLHDCVDMVRSELGALPKNIAPTSEDEAKQTDFWFRAKEAADQLNSAVHLVGQYAKDASMYPLTECTIVSLSCGTALEQGVMLSRVFVSETPDEIVAKLHGGNWS